MLIIYFSGLEMCLLYTGNVFELFYMFLCTIFTTEKTALKVKFVFYLFVCLFVCYCVCMSYNVRACKRMGTRVRMYMHVLYVCVCGYTEIHYIQAVYHTLG